ncbi:MAG: hypothetical protein Q9160_000087 [Pyrenula sp. 1 TL-2023]
MESVSKASPETSGDTRPSGKAPTAEKSVRSPNEVTPQREQRTEFTTPPTDNKTSVRYEYDPISMRKVPKLDHLSQSKSELSSNPCHGSGSDINIPVRKSPNMSLASSYVNEGPAESENGRPGSKEHISRSVFENHEGVSQSNTKAVTQAKKKCVDQINSPFSLSPQLSSSHLMAPNSSVAVKTAMPNAEADAPLFSGTTYEQKAKSILTRCGDEASSWLSREGFSASTKSKTTQPNLSSSELRPSGSSSKTNKIQPSLDRVTADQPSQTQLRNSNTSLAASTPLKHQLTSTKASGLETEHDRRAGGQHLTMQAAPDGQASHLRTDKSLGKDKRAGFGGNCNANRDKQNLTSGPENTPSVSVQDTITCRQEVKSNSEAKVSIHNAQSKNSSTQPQQTLTQKPTFVPEKEFRPNASDRGHGFRSVSKASKTQNPEEKAKLEAEALQQQTIGQARTTTLQKAAEQARIEAEKIQNRLKALIPELKGLYEDRYGMVTVNHRQEPLADSKPSESQRANPTETSDGGATAPLFNSKPANRGHERGDWWQKRRMRRQENLVSLNKREPDTSVSAAQQDQQQYDYTESEETRARNLSYLKDGQLFSESSDKSKPSTLSLYKVLAYDKSTRRITIADTASSFVHVNEEPLHPTEILSRLNRAAKFLPYLEDLQSQGYEIVSGHGDILIFKSTETTKANGLGESPTITSAFSGQRRSPSPRSKIRRREPVFSGAGRTWQQEDRNGSSHEGNIARLAKHVLLTGVVTAGIFYGIGAVAEAMENDGREYRTKGRPGIYSTQDSR